MMVPVTKEEGQQHSTAFIIEEELRVEEDDDDWSFDQQVAKYDDTNRMENNSFLEVSDSSTENVSDDVRGINHVYYDHTYTLRVEGMFPSQSSVTSGKTNIRGSSSDTSSNLLELTRTSTNGSYLYSERKAHSWYEKLSRSMNIPMTKDDIINLPAVEFYEKITQYNLKEPQLSLVREIRRRGKNKIAAQNCRNRKLNRILTLAEEVKHTRERKIRLIKEHEWLMAEKARIKDSLTQLYRHVLQSLRDQEAIRPYSPYEASLNEFADGAIFLIPRAASPQVVNANSTTIDQHS